MFQWLIVNRKVAYALVPLKCWHASLQSMKLVFRRNENRERQKALAMQRLAAKRNQKQKKKAVISLTNADVIYNKLLGIANETNEG